MGVFEYFDPDTNATVYHVLPNSGSNSTISTFQSETESLASGSTIQSDDLPGYFVSHHGRQQPASNNIVRWFPSDNIRRYILRYLSYTWAFGGNYVGPVKEILAPIVGRERRVLELGTKTGTWTQSMAEEFPHVQFRSVDIVPIIAHAPRPNIIFEVYDYTEGILLENESQDAVFLNVIMEMVKDYRALLREVHRVLRPGGLIHIIDHNPRLWDPQTRATAARHTNPVGCHFVDLIRDSLANTGADPDTIDKLPDWLAPDSGVWSDRAGGRKGFERIQSVVRMYPAYPHPGHPCMDGLDARVAPYLAHLSVMSTRDTFGLLRDRGMGDEEAEQLIEDVIVELKNPRNCVLLKPVCVYGVKV
ncbi:hypothetical protein FRC12_025225 [Ceratobasidium sp. 428]|nr:hypothetical protein FRC12_025225 [Ceratobasidium sp. 428]